MTISQFHLAWSRYAVAADMTGQLPYSAAAAHRDNCMIVGLQAAQHKRRAQLALFYDEEARRSWAERSRNGDPSFEALASVSARVIAAPPFPPREVSRAAQKVGRTALERAKAAYDAEESSIKAAAHPPAGFPRAPDGAAAPRQGADAASKPTGQGTWNGGRGSGGAGQQWRAAAHGSNTSWDAGSKKRERSWGDWPRKDARKPRTPPRPAR